MTRTARWRLAAEVPSLGRPRAAPVTQDLTAFSDAVERMDILLGAYSAWVTLGGQIAQSLRETVAELRRTSGLGADNLPFVEVEAITSTLTGHDGALHLDLATLQRAYAERRRAQP